MVVLAAVGKGLDFDQGLTVQEQKDSGDTVSQRFAIAFNKLSQPCQTLLLGERAAGRLLLGDLHRLVHPGFLGPGQQVSDL